MIRLFHADQYCVSVERFSNCGKLLVLNSTLTKRTRVGANVTQKLASLVLYITFGSEIRYDTITYPKVVFPSGVYSCKNLGGNLNQGKGRQRTTCILGGVMRAGLVWYQLPSLRLPTMVRIMPGLPSPKWGGRTQLAE